MCDVEVSDIKCLLFDNDGTLVESEYLGCLGLEYKLRELDIDVDARRLAIKYKGWKLADLLNLLAEQHGFEFDEEFIADYRKIVSGLFRQHLQAVDGVEKILAQLPHPKAVVSNGPRGKIRETLMITGLEKYFAENIFSAYEEGVWKPDPELYLAAARGMGFPACECAVIDDSMPGIKAGVDAGMKTYFYNPLQEPCELAGAISFTSMAQLPALLTSS